MLNLAATCAEFGLAKLFFDTFELFANDDGHPFWSRQNVQQVINLCHDFFVFGNDFVLLQACQALQTHLQDFLCLGFRQSVQAIVTHAVRFLQTIRAVVIGIDNAAIGSGTGEHLAHQTAVPRTQHQFSLCYRRCGCVANDGNKFINVGQRYGQTFQHMTTFARFAKCEHGTPRHHFTAMR